MYKKLIAFKFADLFFQYVFCLFSLLATITSDKGSLFTSKFWLTLYSYFTISRRLSTAYYP